MLDSYDDSNTFISHFLTLSITFSHLLHRVRQACTARVEVMASEEKRPLQRLPRL